MATTIKTIGVKLGREDLQRLESLCEQSRLTTSELVRTLLHSVETVTPATTQVRPLEVYGNEQHSGSQQLV